MRQLGVHYRTAWLIHCKMEAICEREHAYPLRGKVQIDDAYLGGERNVGKLGCRSVNKVPIAAGDLWMTRASAACEPSNCADLLPCLH
jgi:hypothetical protein